MPEVDKSALLKVPASDVFALLVQVERNPEWVPRMVSSERLTSGPTAVGTRFRFALDLEFMGIVIDGVDEVVELVPDRLIRSRSVEGSSVLYLLLGAGAGGRRRRGDHGDVPDGLQAPAQS